MTDTEEFAEAEKRVRKLGASLPEDFALTEAIGALIDAYETKRSAVLHVAIRFPNEEYLEWNGERFVRVPRKHSD